MNTKNIILGTVFLFTLVLLFSSAFTPSLAFAAGGYAALGRRVGLIVGLLVGAFVMFRVHPILGIITLIGGGVAIFKM